MPKPSTPPTPSTNPAYVFHREKYLEILRAQGAHEALTALHLDIERWEYGAFEGHAGEAGDGYRAERVKALKAARDFSRELWDMGIEKDAKAGARA